MVSNLETDKQGDTDEGGEMKCPRCKMGAIEMVPFGKNEIVAVCRHVRKCGLRILVPVKKDRYRYVQENWRKEY